MSKTKRLFCMALFVLFLLTSCGSAPQDGGSTVSGDGLQQAVPGGQTSSDGAEIALFITEEQKNQGLGQAVWSAVSRFSGEEGVTYGPYTVDAQDVDAALATVDLAVKSSAKVLVAIGDEMAGVVERAQVLYTELQFILLGVEETPALRANAVLLEYDELQAGWLAGYAAVLEGYRVLAFVENAPSAPDEEETGEATEGETAGEQQASEEDSVTRLRNLGFVLGAEAAAADIGLEPGAVQVQTLQMVPGQSATGRRETIANLYESGVELLFAGDGMAQNDALRVARGLGTGLIGVSLNFAYDDAASVASVEAVAGQPLYSLLKAWKSGSFPSDRVYYCGLGDEGYTLDSTGFARFTDTQYGTLVARFTSGAYAAALHSGLRGDDGQLVSPLLLETEYVLLAAAEIDEDTGLFLPPDFYSLLPEGEGEEGGVAQEPAASAVSTVSSAVESTTDDPEETFPEVSSAESPAKEEPAAEEGDAPPAEE